MSVKGRVLGVAEKSNIPFVIGATGSGKLAAAMIVAERLSAEIISVDSMKVYRGMDIGTAKPHPKDRRVPMHMIDMVEPYEEYSVARFVKEAGEKIEEVMARGRLPLLVGGSSLYIKGLVDGIFEGPGADWSLREHLAKQAELMGVETIHAELMKVDPIAASRIEKNDLRRIIRALEVYSKTRRPISSFQIQFGRGNPRFSFRIVGIRRDRKDLYARIDARVDHMFKSGLVEEVKRLVTSARGLSKSARQAVGYKEVMGFLEGRYDMAEAVRLVKRNSRHLARRQIMWFKHFPDVEWIDVAADDPTQIVAERIMTALGY